MRAFRFLHTADLHLDSPFRGMSSLPPVIRERCIASTFQALQNVVNLAIKEQVDFIVMGGDIFDLADRSIRAQIRFQEAMMQLAKEQIQVFIVHGNHDPEEGKRAQLSWPDSVHFFSSQDVQKRVAYNRQGEVVANIYGISYPTAAVSENLAKRFRAEDPQIYNIGLLHCNVDVNTLHEPYAPCTKLDLLETGMDYWALGHVHTAQILHESPYIVYPGNIQGRHVRETGEKGCFIVTVDEWKQSQLTFHTTDSIRWYHQKISIEELQTEQELTDAFYDLMEHFRSNSDGRASMVRIHLEGRGPLHHVLQQRTQVQEWLEHLREQELNRIGQDPHYPFVWIENVQVHTGVEVDKHQLLHQDSFLGDLLRISRDLLADEQQFASFCQEVFEDMLHQPKMRTLLQSVPLEEQKEWLRAAEELAIHYLYDDERSER